jgi:hypothetical protein
MVGIKSVPAAIHTIHFREWFSSSVLTCFHRKGLRWVRLGRVVSRKWWKFEGGVISG